MKPSVGTERISLSHCAVQAAVIKLGLRGQMRFQYLHAVRPQIFMDRVLRVPEVRQLARAGRTVFAARGGEALADPVIAKRALLGHVFLRMQKAAPVRTGLNTIAAAETVFFVYQDHAVW